MNTQTIKQRLLEGHTKWSLAILLLSFIYLIMFFVPAVTMNAGFLSQDVRLSALITKSPFTFIAFASGVTSLLLAAFRLHRFAFIPAIPAFLLSFLQLFGFFFINQPENPNAATVHYLPTLTLMLVPIAVFIVAIIALIANARNRRVTRVEAAH